jgi:hypothetical protein
MSLIWAEEVISLWEREAICDLSKIKADNYCSPLIAALNGVSVILQTYERCPTLLC